MVDYNGIIAEIKEQYLEDTMPWVIGFSGGKDSTLLLQLVYYALYDLPKKLLKKEIHVLSNDTLVENPVIIKNLDSQLKNIETVGKKDLFSHNPKLFKVVKTTPKITDTFWVNLIGKGYPSPNRWFRWCTQRMKINPTTEYVKTIANKNGEAIVLLGTRKAESAARSMQMTSRENGTRLKKYTLPNTYVYTPIAELTNDDVWIYLLQVKNPWNCDNKRLVALYKNASGECPLVMETGTQSCGSSRFGCWTCTVVRKDQSLENLIDHGNEWMQDLLDFRNHLAQVRLQDGQYVPNRIAQKVKYGPFLLKTRKKLFERLLELQSQMEHSLITDSEVKYIKKIFKKDYTQVRLKKFVCKLSNGNKVTIISDYNPITAKRPQIANMRLKDAKLLKTQNLTTGSDFLQSTRVIYY